MKMRMILGSTLLAMGLAAFVGGETAIRGQDAANPPSRVGPDVTSGRRDEPVKGSSGGANPAATLGRGRSTIHHKLETIIFDEFTVSDIRLTEVVKQLTAESRKRDPDRRGINFMISSQAAPKEAQTASRTVDPTNGGPKAGLAQELPLIVEDFTVRIEPPLRNVRLVDVLNAVIKTAKPAAGQPQSALLKYSVEDYAVVFSQRASESTHPHPAAELEGIDIEIHDGQLGNGRRATVGNLVSYLQELVPSQNVVLSPGVAEITVNDLKLRSATVRGLLEAVAVATDRRVQPTLLEGTTWALTTRMTTPAPQREVEVFNLSGYLQGVGKPEGKEVKEQLRQIEEVVVETLSAVRPSAGRFGRSGAGGGFGGGGGGNGFGGGAPGGAMNVGVSEVPEFRFHPGAGLFIVIGSREAIDVTRKIVSALPGQAPQTSAYPSGSVGRLFPGKPDPNLLPGGEPMKGRVTVLGQVMTQGSVEIPDGRKLNVSEAIGASGGYTRMAAPAKVTVERVIDGQKEIIKVNPEDKNAPQFNLLPGDIVRVGERVF